MTQKDRESADRMKGSDGKVSGNPDEKSQTKLISLRENVLIETRREE